MEHEFQQGKEGSGSDGGCGDNEMEWIIEIVWRLTPQTLLKWSIRKGVGLRVLKLKVKNKHGNKSNCVEDRTMKSQFPTLTPHS